MLKLALVPVQPLNTGVTNRFPVIAVKPLLVAVNVPILPLPEDAIPIAELELLQL